MSTREEQLNGMAAYLSERLTPVLDSVLRNATRCCLNCEHFDNGPRELCKLNDKRPPVRIVTFGCECFVDNEVPF